MKAFIAVLALALLMTSCSGDDEPEIQRPIGSPTLKNVTIEGNTASLNSNPTISPYSADGRFRIDYESTGWNYNVLAILSDNPSEKFDDDNDFIIGLNNYCLLGCDTADSFTCRILTDNTTRCSFISWKDITPLLNEIPTTLYLKVVACSDDYCTDIIVNPIGFQ